MKLKFLNHEMEGTFLTPLHSKKKFLENIESWANIRAPKNTLYKIDLVNQHYHQHDCIIFTSQV